MKFIAPSDFSQGPRNPLKIPGGSAHVKKGTIFEIGGDLPPDEFTGDDLEIYSQLFAAQRICPLDSVQGQQLAAEFKTKDYNYNPRSDDPTGGKDVFILFNEQESLVEKIVQELDSKGISTYFWRRDIPVGEEWEKIEAQQLNDAKVVLVFLGQAGWGPNHLRITEDAQRLQKRILPILIGQPPQEDFEKANALFRIRRYLDLRILSPASITLLVEEIRPSARSNNRLDNIIQGLINGNEGERWNALQQTHTLSSSDQISLSIRLRTELAQRFSPQPKTQLDSARDPTKVPSIRSWILSAIIAVDAEGAESRECILKHLQLDFEPYSNVRFWILAELYHCNASYLGKAIEVSSSDTAPEVSSLARAIAAPDDPKLHSDFRAKLSGDSVTSWPILRALRIVPIPQLAEDVCILLNRSMPGTKSSYDSLYALCIPAVAREAEGLLSVNPGTSSLVDRILEESSLADENAAMHFAILLAEFNPSDVDRYLEIAHENPKFQKSAEKLQRFLRDQRKQRHTPSIPNGYLHGPAGYTSEFCGIGGTRAVSDHLGVESLAQRLSELIVLRETKLPLAVGLFGNWGSGKSHFMNLMDRHMKKLALETAEDWNRRAAESGSALRFEASDKGPWCREIVPVYFNAWHYVDTNLWASLVSQIFESLYIHLRPKADALANMQALLEQASGATARAVEAVALAHASTEHAKENLRIAKESRQNQETFINGLVQGLKSLLPELKPADLQEDVIELLDVRRQVNTLQDLRGVLREAHSFGGRCRRLWNATKRKGLGWRVMWLLATVVLAPLLPAIVARIYPNTKDWLHGVGQFAVWLLAGLSTIFAWIRPIVTEAGSCLKKVEDLEKKAEAAQERAAETPAVRIATDNLAALEAKEAAAKIRFAAAEGHEKQLMEEAQNLSPERRLGRFIEHRAQSSDYRGHLGLVSLARRDFQELSEIFSDKSALREKFAKLPLSGGSGKKGAEEQIETLNKSIDRIVLFVDDLDRCQPEKVVEVLQAVHLLLAFPLFAVVVGVDQRCLRQSLKMQFKGMLTVEAAEKDDQNIETSTDEGEPPATPLDYLEKIFHIPFHLPEMERQGFSTLIEKLTESAATSTEGKLPIAAPGSKIVGANASPKPDTNIESMKGGGLAGAASPETLSKHKDTASGAAIAVSEDPPRAGALDSGNLLNLSRADGQVVGSVPLNPWEREAIKDYHSLIRTPRAATRLLNTYRLVRAGIPSEEWNAFRGDEALDGEFRVAMLLLAAAAGYPAVARNWFDAIRSANSTTLFFSDDPVGPDRVGWTKFKKVYDTTFVSNSLKPTKEMFLKWLNRVERFAF